MQYEEIYVLASRVDESGVAQASYGAFAAILSDGTVVTWGVFDSKPVSSVGFRTQGCLHWSLMLGESRERGRESEREKLRKNTVNMYIHMYMCVHMHTYIHKHAAQVILYMGTDSIVYLCTCEQQHTVLEGKM